MIKQHTNNHLKGNTKEKRLLQQAGRKQAPIKVQSLLFLDTAYNLLINTTVTHTPAIAIIRNTNYSL